MHIIIEGQFNDAEPTIKLRELFMDLSCNHCPTIPIELVPNPPVSKTMIHQQFAGLFRKKKDHEDYLPKKRFAWYAGLYIPTEDANQNVMCYVSYTSDNPSLESIKKIISLIGATMGDSILISDWHITVQMHAFPPSRQYLSRYRLSLENSDAILQQLFNYDIPKMKELANN